MDLTGILFKKDLKQHVLPAPGAEPHLFFDHDASGSKIMNSPSFIIAMNSKE